MNIKILGSGCRKCQALTHNVETAANDAGIDVCIEKLTDITDIARYGVMSTPGLVVNDKVVSTGKVLSVTQITEHLRSFSPEPDVNYSG